MIRTRSKRVLFVTQLDIWSMSTKKSGATMGNQSLYNTLLGYARHGYQVHLFTSATRLSSNPTLPQNITVHRHPLPGRSIWHAAKKIKRWLLRRPYTDTACSKVVSDLEYRQYLVLHKVLPFYLWAFWWVLLLMLRYRFDLLYGYEIFGTPVAWIWSRVFSRPVISRFQGTLMSKYLNSPEKILYNWTHWMPMKLPVNLLIMTNDGTQGDKVLDYLKVPITRRVFWRNGVELAQGVNPKFDNIAFRRLNSIDEDTMLLTSASRMTYWKRIDRMIHAASLVPHNRKFKLIIIGDGENRDALEALARDLGVADKVHFTGPLPHRDVLKWHSAADVLISTFDVSNVGNQLLEAQVLGKPYITVNTGDTAHVLTHEYNGLLIQTPDDYLAIADAISRLIDDNSLRGCLANGAKEFGLQHIKTWTQRMEMEIATVEERLGWIQATPHNPEEMTTDCEYNTRN